MPPSGYDRFLGRHFLYRTYLSVIDGKHRMVEAELVIRPPSFFRRDLACAWRTLDLNPPLTATGTARISRGLCTISLQAVSGLADIPFFYVFEDDASPELADLKIGVVAGRTSTTLSPYHAEVLLARSQLSYDVVSSLIGPKSSGFVRLAQTKTRLARAVPLSEEEMMG